MPDNKKKTGPADRERIAVTQKHELSYWSKKFGISKGLLKHAVREAGVMVKDVKAWLKNPDSCAGRHMADDGLPTVTVHESRRFESELGYEISQGACDRDDMVKAFRLGLLLGGQSRGGTQPSDPANEGSAA